MSAKLFAVFSEPPTQTGITRRSTLRGEKVPHEPLVLLPSQNNVAQQETS